MKTVTIDIPDTKTEKLFNEFAEKYGISLRTVVKRAKPSEKISNKLAKAEQEYEDKVDRNIEKMIDLTDAKGTKLVSRAIIMKNLGR